LALSMIVFLHPREQKLRAKPSQRRVSVEQDSAEREKMNETTSAIMLDSIVSLVQNYYVDPERVASDQLIVGTMRSLAFAIPELIFRDSDNKYSLTTQSQTLEFAHDQEMEYEVLLGHLKSLIGFCDRVHIEQLMNEGENIMLGDERNSTSIVLNAMLSSLDAHSSLLSSEGYQDLRQGTEGAFGGLGVLVGVRNNILTVLKALPNSPAIRNGVRKDDKILSIDGYSTYGKSLDALVSHMRGEPGSKAKLLTLREGDKSPKLQALQREIIEVNSVEEFEYKQGNHYILRLVVESFAARTSQEIVSSIHKFRKKRPLGGIVLDLRGNPGGLLDQAVVVSDIFLDKGVVVTTRGRRQEIERAGHTNDEVDFPLVVLMDEGSASASEIVAGALQDNGRAVVVGQPSFGKGSVQTVFELPALRALKLTIARYFTPADKSIQNIGIIPDVWTQPIYRTADSTNIFGPYRYRNEQFLPNRLNSTSVPKGGAGFPMIKGFHFVKENTQSSTPEALDPEMNIAMEIFSRVGAIYGNHLPVGARRASHWLALSGPTIRGNLAKTSNDVFSWLATSQKVNWKSSIDHRDEASNLVLKIYAPESGLKSTSNGRLDVPWKISNVGKQASENVSVFIQSAVSGLETKEILVGVIEGGQSREGVFKVTIPSAMVSGHHYVTSGIAIDAQAVKSGQGEFLIDVVDRNLAQLSMTVEFVDAMSSGAPKVIEANESAALRVVVANKTSEDILGAKLIVSSLAGEQISLATKEFSAGNLSAGEQREIMVPIVAKSVLDSQIILIGLALKQSSNVSEVFATAEIPTLVPVAAIRDAENLSH
jgi:carboxyl-terminal processing protease